VEINKLIVRDDELDVGDDEVASSEVAEVGERAGKLWGRGSGYPAPVYRAWGERWSPKTPYFKL
jgi:hypothetical protein